jgi:hypothetical protein
MQKRTIAILLVVVGAALILAVLGWLFLGKKSIKQPPAPQPSPTIRTSPPVAQPMPTSGAPVVSQSEQQLQDQLKRQASDFAARMGSYSSLDEFAGIKNVYVNATPAVQTFLESERQTLTRLHPIIGPSFGQTARALTSRITSPLPIEKQTRVQLTVQVQHTIEDGSKIDVEYAEVQITLERQDAAWIVSRVSSESITL